MTIAKPRIEMIKRGQMGQPAESKMEYMLSTLAELKNRILKAGLWITL